MKSPKSFIAALLFVVISILSCKRKHNDVVPQGDALVISISGGYAGPSTSFKTVEITESASYSISYTNGQRSNVVTLPENVHNNLKQYLRSFPRTAIKSDPKNGKYSGFGAADLPFQTFSYVQASPADTTSFYIDSPYSGQPVAYMDDFVKNINKIITDYKLLP